MAKKKTKKMNIDPEFGLDSRYKSKKESKSEATLLMEARLERMKNLSSDQVLRAKLLQLKIKMEEFVKRPVYDDHNYFANFLKNYVDIIYSKRSNFANDIDITPVKLSQVINSHREPEEEFILRLMIHSEKVYKNICDFQKMTWFQVYFHEKLCDTMASLEKWRPQIEKHVKFSESTIK